MVTAPANAGTNLILNGSFETPYVPPGLPGPRGGWVIFYEPTTGLGWIPILPGGMEIQNHVSGWGEEPWNAYDGNQLAELDGIPPYNNGGMYQTVNTIPGQEYNLSFALSPRPGLAGGSSGIEIYWNNVSVDTFTTDGTGLTNTVWSIRNYTLTATGISSELKFLAIGNGDGLGSLIDDVKLTLAVPELSCEGFEPPMNNGPVKVRKKLVALPLKMQLSDEGGLIIDADIAAPPVLQVLYDSGVGAAKDVTGNALPALRVTIGNQFFFTKTGKWNFNLGAWHYSAPGTYTISVVSGDETEYVINPTCTATFVVE
jgi:hypothetical protein